MTKHEIIDLLLEGDADSVGQAIKAMRAIMPNDNTILNLAGQWNRLQKDINGRVISPERADLLENQLLDSLMQVAKKLPDTTPPDPKPNGGAGGGSPTVFLSYNHKDSVDANKVKDYLLSKGIRVTIDAEAMKPGEDIAAFINKSIREADVTLSLVSTNSLLSPWVGMETLNTLVGENIAGKYFIAVVILGDFYTIDFVDNSIKTIDERLVKIKKVMKQRIEKDQGIEDLQNERTRNQSLKNDLPKIVANLKARLNVDIIGDNFNAGMDRVAKAILNK